VLHRIIEITNVGGELQFVTQGDQNQTADPTPVSLEGPGDKVVYSVPYAGYILKFSGSTAGQIFLIGVPLLVLAVIFGRDLVRNRRAERESATAAATAQLLARPVPSSRVAEAAQPATVVPAAATVTATPVVRLDFAAERIRLHEVPLLKMVPLGAALSEGPGFRKIRVHKASQATMVPLATALDLAYAAHESEPPRRQELQAA
jgi:hypothetical protein